MKLVITSDLHLTTHQKNPERFQALESMLQQMIRDDIDYIIIAGDLFDAESRNYAEFDALCKNEKYKNIHFYIVPGNHDVRLKSSFITTENVTIFSEPKIWRFDKNDLPFLFLPYEKDKTMGEKIAAFSSELRSDEWILIGHGDWVEGMRESNPMEPGVYMPLTRIDLENYRPVRAFLGHIHKPVDTDVLYYAGSPSPLDITETGRRRFLILDTETGEVRSQVIKSGVIYFNESFIILPVEDERAYVKSQIEYRIKNWNLTEDEKTRIKIRVSVRGYTSDKTALVQIFKESLNEFNYYKNKGPDFSEVFISDDVDRTEIANRVLKQIHELELSQESQQPEKEQILLEALKVIYGE